jgi:hypothetical protein
MVMPALHHTALLHYGIAAAFGGGAGVLAFAWWRSEQGDKTGKPRSRRVA